MKFDDKILVPEFRFHKEGDKTITDLKTENPDFFNKLAMDSLKEFQDIMLIEEQKFLNEYVDEIRNKDFPIDK